MPRCKRLLTIKSISCAGKRARMFTARKKIAKEKGAEPDDFEESVAQVRCCGKQGSIDD
jgi:hypothetical protein